MSAQLPDPSKFSQMLDELVDQQLAAIAGAIGRDLDMDEARLARSLFWSRTSGTRGNWISVDFIPGLGPRLALDAVFARGYVAFASRIIGGGTRVALALAPCAAAH